MKKQIKEFYGDDPKKSSDYGKIINSRYVKPTLLNFADPTDMQAASSTW